MPRDIPTYTECAPPGVARSHQLLGGIAGLIINGIISQTILTVGALLAVLIGLILLANPAAWVVFAAVIVAEAERAKDWYYNGRLLCIRDRDCALGTVISEPTASFDGDRKLNLLLAPYTQADWVEATVDHLETNRGMLNTPATYDDPPFYPSGAPFLPSPTDVQNDFGKVRDYLSALRSEHPGDGDAEPTIFRQLQIGIVDRVLADPARNFYRRYFRKDAAHIPPGSPLDEAIPEDFDPTVNWDDANARSGRTHFNPYLRREETLNPMFRYEPPHVVPYLHCEIDGYFVALLIDNAIMAFLAFVALAIALAPLGPLGPVIALAIAALLFLLKSLFDSATGNDGDAEPPDVEDPDAPGATTTIRKGDVVLTYGNWIMDTEHHNFFEIHPVRAYYLIARNSADQMADLEQGELVDPEFGNENFDVTDIDAVRENDICRIVTGGEEGESDDVILLRAPQALSMGMVTRFAGGRAARRDD